MREAVEVGMCIFGVALFVATLVATPRLLRRLPPDYLVREPPKRPWGRRMAINAGAVVVIGLGIAMLALPGPGILTVLLGIAHLDLPFRRRALTKLLRQPKVQHVVQTLRARAGQPPLEVPA